jgi:hypothetical protein
LQSPRRVFEASTINPVVSLFQYLSLWAFGESGAGNDFLPGRSRLGIDGLLRVLKAAVPY